MKKRKTIISIVCIFLLIGIGIRVYVVNSNAEMPVVEYYPMGEFVDLEDDFFYYSKENTEGYRFRVNTAAVLTYEEFLKEHQLKEEDVPTKSGIPRPKYIYDLDVTIEKTVNTELDYEGINLWSMRLMSTNDSFQVHDDLFGALYPQLYMELGFALRGNSQMHMHLPYVALPLWEYHYDIDSIKRTEFRLRLSNYPVKKMIIIK